MEWLLKHPILIFVIVMVVSSLLKKMKAPEETPSSSKDLEPRGDGVDDSERTRRLQEEIRRKIAERRGQPVLPPVLVSGPETSVWTEKEEEPWAYRREEPPPVVEEAAAIDPILERQRALAEQLAALQLHHATVSKASQEAWAPRVPVSASASINFEEMNWLRELRSARSLRKAIILREVIGPPVALR
ncbi:MAG TPA: hypothetical protein VL357_07855 [Rariglobus sp.]|jgi:hypothetical protein|nr:hypothetical protein [Rariglobus sp.]